MCPYRTRARKTLAQRFWPKVDTSGECWLWTGARTKGGYGYLTIETPGHRASMTAHRIAWELHNGPIPDGLWVLHRCDNPPCVNPEHLFLGTQGDNLADMSAKGRASSVRARGEHNGQAKLTEADVRRIRVDHGDGISSATLAQRHSVSTVLINRIIRRDSWKHVA